MTVKGTRQDDQKMSVPDVYDRACLGAFVCVCVCNFRCEFVSVSKNVSRLANVCIADFDMDITS